MQTLLAPPQVWRALPRLPSTPYAPHPRLQGRQARRLAATYLHALRRGQQPQAAALGACPCGTWGCWACSAPRSGWYLFGAVPYRALRYALHVWGYPTHCAT